MKKLVLNMGTVAKIRVLGLAFLSIILGSSELAWGQDYSSVVDGDWEESLRRLHKPDEHSCPRLGKGD